MHVSVAGGLERCKLYFRTDVLGKLLMMQKKRLQMPTLFIQPGVIFQHFS
jgi:hypothetical protein